MKGPPKRFINVSKGKFQESKKKMTDHIVQHFDSIAQKYDKYKERKRYYYDAVKTLYKELIKDPEKKSILEIGCGTGDIIAHLNPKDGIGMDISKKMIELAKRKHKSIKFVVGAAEEIPVKEQFDYVIMPDVIEHLKNVRETINQIEKRMKKDAALIITMANILWEPFLLAGEKLRLKMPEGPHYRISKRKLLKILWENNLKVVRNGNRLLIPKKIPLFHHINNMFYNIPGINKLGLIEYMVIKKRK